MKKRLWPYSFPSDPAFQLARYEFFPTRRIGLHTHEYSEITLVESGEGRQIVNGTTLPLRTGDIFLIRPADSHSFDANNSGLGIINLVFPTKQAIDLEARYFPDGNRYFRSTEKLPWSTHLDAESFTQAENLFNNLESAEYNLFELERAIMNLFAILQKPLADLPLGHAPDWLRHACAEIRQPAHLAEGLPALVRFAGRSPEHIARELRRHGGCTPSEFINRLRINHAARMLCSTDKSVLGIALDCGFENQGYFHRCFKARFETTPLRYRKDHHSLIF